MTTLLTLPYLRVHLHEGPLRALELEWLSYAASADFRAAALQVLALTRQHHAQSWIGDDRQLGAVRPRDLEWARQHILIGLDQEGLQRFALLESQDALNRRTINGMYEQADPAVGFEIQRFEQLDLARAWACGAELP